MFKPFCSFCYRDHCGVLWTLPTTCLTTKLYITWEFALPWSSNCLPRTQELHDPCILSVVWTPTVRAIVPILSWIGNEEANPQHVATAQGNKVNNWSRALIHHRWIFCSSKLVVFSQSLNTKLTMVKRSKLMLVGEQHQTSCENHLHYWNFLFLHRNTKFKPDINNLSYFSLHESKSRLQNHISITCIPKLKPITIILYFLVGLITQLLPEIVSIWAYLEMYYNSSKGLIRSTFFILKLLTLAVIIII